MAVDSFERAVYLDTYVTNKLLRDEESIKIARMLMDNVCIDIARYYNYSTNATLVYLVDAISSPTAVVSTLEAVETAAKTAAEIFFGEF